MAHYTLLNEGLATALQLIVYERFGLPAEDFYKDPYIPRIALATRPVLKKALAEGSTLYSEFATEYMRAVDAELGEEAWRPCYMLAGTAVLGLDEHPAAAVAYMKLLPPRSSTRSEEDVERFPEFNVVRLLTFNDLGSIAKLLPDGATVERRGFAYSPEPTSKRGDYWLAGRDDNALVDVIEKFVALEDVTGSRLLVTID